MMIFLSIIFWLLLYISVIILVGTYVILSFFIKDKEFIARCTVVWSRFVMWALKFIVGIDYEIIDRERIPKQPCIIACKHQSMWETIIFHTLFLSPVYIYKKELLKIPVYGWYVSRMNCIKVDRSAGSSALKDMLKQTKSYLSKGYNIVIFPQGTRVPYNANSDKFPYQVGIAAMYLSANVCVVPAVLDSGKFWDKSMIMKRRGKIKLRFLEPIKPGLDKKEFMEILENGMENFN